MLVLYEHPLLPTGTEVADAMAAWTDRLAGTGRQLSDSTADLPDLTRIAQTYTGCCWPFSGRTCRRPPTGRYNRPPALPPGQLTDQALELRALASSHRDWIIADRQRTGIRHAWRQFFTRWDLVVCPEMPLTALPHDDTPAEQRTIRIGQQTFRTTGLVCGRAWPRWRACRRPRSRSAAARRGCRSACRR
ncbi:MAG: hypothetical protein R3E68_01565 [Burkholderiaceae bacterium]